ncbi:MarR family winged helix-turn-helix transcriptional regulator [Allostreptomyces psammosilenae]|uniref:DNA-binding MarR family transcriptional regulator n=1 Tax=Allostreptomyces psammosilenae TaxID=1892865 RepID=A0A852ZVR5_9ACTN|nr:DNA-binding MarR family transcriptional regulator [Allostreptomyces psammosilenae]
MNAPDTDTPHPATPDDPIASGRIDWLSDSEQRLWRGWLQATRLLNTLVERDLNPFDLTMYDYEILVNLSEAPERRMRMTDLAMASVQSKSRLSHQITRMEKAGLVRRESCDQDRRGLYAVLTEHGWDTIRAVAPHHVASVRQHFIDLLDDERRAALASALEPVLRHLEESRDRP